MTQESDTPVDTGVGEENGAGAEEQSAGDSGKQSYLGTYKSRDEAEKGLREKEALIARLQSERDRAQNEGTKLHDLLEQLVKSQTQKGEPKSKQDDEAHVQSLVDEIAGAFREDEGKGARKTLQILSAYVGDVEAKTRDEIGKTRKELEELTARQIGELRTLLEERDPEYVSQREKIKELSEELGLDPKQHRSLLMKLAQRESKTARPPRHDLPGSLGNGSGRGGDGDDSGEMTAEQEAIIASFIGGKLTAEEKKALRRRR